MPELPDLQVFSRNLNKMLKGKTIVKMQVYNSQKINISLALAHQIFHGAVIHSIVRDGKYLLFHFNNGHKLAVHLMLHGQLYVANDGVTVKHPVLQLDFSDGMHLTLDDWQQAAHALVDVPASQVPDALDPEMDFSYLKQALQNNGKNIKSILLDQLIVRGIGNAYADEILWEARISPYSSGRKIPGAQVRRLLQSMRRVLTRAERNIRKVHPGIISGEVRDFLLIHHPDRELSPGGFPIQVTTLASRKTYFTDEQELYI